MIKILEENVFISFKILRSGLYQKEKRNIY